MRVLQINSVCGIRSTGRICTDIADVLVGNGHECKIVYGRASIPEKYKRMAYRIGSETNVMINALKARLLDNEGFNAKKQTKQLIDFIEDYKPDIVHLHNLHGYYINLEILLSYLAESRMPTICTMHDCWAITGHCSHFISAKCERWKTGCYNCPQRKAYPSNYGFDHSKKNWEKKKTLYNAVKNMTIVTPSRWLADVMSESYIGAKRIEVIPNGINMDVFKPTKSNFRKQYNIQEKIIVLGVATAWTKEKGLNELIALQKELGNSYQVVLVGLSNKQIKALPTGVIGIERTNNIRELAAIYTAADVFVNAGQEETMGLTTVEAMACGTPVVVSNLTAVPEVVTELGGLIFKEYSISCIAQCVREVLEKKYLHTRENAKIYEKQIQYNKYLSLYYSMLKG